MSAAHVTEVTGATALAGALEDLGVELVFGLPGVHNLAAWAALEASAVRLVGVRHEQTAVYAADGLARATGELGVALTTTGPGAANALAATGEAWASGSPVLVIATDVPTTLRHASAYRGALHETTDQRALFAPLTKRCLRAEAAGELPALVRAAAALALAAPAGPVFLEVPTDLLDAAAGQPAGGAPATPSANPPSAPDAAAMDAALALLRAAERPLIWAGGGAVQAGAGEAVAALAARLGAPVIETFGARGLVPRGHPGWVGLPPHVPEVGALWDEADVVLAIGSAFDAMNTQSWAMPQPPALIAINADPEAAATTYPPDVRLTADAHHAARAIAAGLSDLPSAAPRARLDAIRGAVQRRIAAEEPLAASLLATLGAAVPDDAVVVADMCIPGYWIAGFHPFPAPRRLAYPVGWGTLGFAFPASVGAALAHPGPTLCVCGDGGFLFACGELALVAQERVPVTVLLVDDGGYGMLRYDQRHAGQPTVGVDLRTPDWLALAGAFGLPARAVDDPGEPLRAALADELARRRPAMIVLRAALDPPPTTSPRWYRGRPAPTEENPCPPPHPL